ncbi:MAG: 50S ribosomal protein L25 [bacterium]|nr:50S ribosomal protein L25 [bacterium]
MERPKLQAQLRTVVGKQVKKLRREGVLPANVFGKGIKSISLQIPIKDFIKVYEKVGESGLVDLTVDGDVKPVLIQNVQLHPVSDDLLHADFHQVSLIEKTSAMVPVETVGESPAVEQKLGILIQPMNELEVEALPQDLPEQLTVDISGLVNVGDALTIADIKISSKIEIKASPDEVVVKIDALAKEEEVVPPPAAEGEVPAEGEEAVPEGGEAEGEGKGEEEKK